MAKLEAAKPSTSLTDGAAELHMQSARIQQDENAE